MGAMDISKHRSSNRVRLWEAPYWILENDTYADPVSAGCLFRKDSGKMELGVKGFRHIRKMVEILIAVAQRELQIP